MENATKKIKRQLFYLSLLYQKVETKNTLGCVKLKIRFRLDTWPLPFFFVIKRSFIGPLTGRIRLTTHFFLIDHESLGPLFGRGGRTKPIEIHLIYNPIIRFLFSKVWSEKSFLGWKNKEKKLEDSPSKLAKII